MTDETPRKPAYRTLALVAIASAAAGFAAGYFLAEQIDSWIDGGDTPIIVRDGSIVITSVGEDLNGFSKPDPKVLIHPKTNAKLGKLKVQGQSKGSPCQGSKECGVEFVWSTGTPGQPGYQEYTVVVGSNSGNGKTASIVSSVPFSQYTASQAPDPTTGKTAFTYTWSPAGATLTFLQARLHTTPIKPGLPKLTPQVLCSNPGCRIEFEYK